MSYSNRQQQSFNGFQNNNRGNLSGDRPRSRSRSPRGRAPSSAMLNRPVTAQDLPGLRLVDLQAISQNMGLNIGKSQNKDRLIEEIAFALNTSRPVYLDQSVASLTSTGGQKSPRTMNMNVNYNQQAFAQFAQQLINQTKQQSQNQIGNNGRGSGNFGGYRSEWQFLVSRTVQWAKEQGLKINAAQAAKMLGPFYHSKIELANKSNNRGSGNFNGAQTSNRQVNANRGSGNFTGQYNNQDDLRQFVNNFNAGNNQGNFSSQWTALISAVSRKYNVNAAEAAKMLDPYYKSQRERFANQPGNQSRGRNNGNRGSGNFTGMMNGFSGMNLNGNRGSGNFTNNASTFGGPNGNRL